MGASIPSIPYVSHEGLLVHYICMIFSKVTVFFLVKVTLLYNIVLNVQVVIQCIFYYLPTRETYS